MLAPPPSPPPARPAGSAPNRCRPSAQGRQPTGPASRTIQRPSGRLRQLPREHDRRPWHRRPPAVAHSSWTADRVGSGNVNGLPAVIPAAAPANAVGQLHRPATGAVATSGNRQRPSCGPTAVGLRSRLLLLGDSHWSDPAGEGCISPPPVDRPPVAGMKIECYRLTAPAQPSPHSNCGTGWFAGWLVGRGPQPVGSAL